MKNSAHEILIENWNIVSSLLPKEWKEQIWQKGVLLRKAHKFPDEDSLLRVLLCYLASGKSFRTTSALSLVGEKLDISDVAIMHRLHASGDFFEWMSQKLLLDTFPKPGKYTLRLIDGTSLAPCKNGTQWRAHFSFQVPSMKCDQFLLDTNKKAESFKNFTVNPGDLFLGDRAYGRHNDVRYVLENQGDVLVRISPTKMHVYNFDNERIDLLSEASCLESGEMREISAIIPFNDLTIPVRVAIYKKTTEQAEKEVKRVKRKSSKSQHTIQQSTIDAAQYVFIVTTVEREINTAQIFNLYRVRWQVELYIKRLKSLLKIEQYKQFSNDKNAKAWLQGKLFIAILVENILEILKSFFPSKDIKI